MNPKKASDLLFEYYLLSQGLAQFEYEKVWPYTDRKPDYTLTHNNETYLFDVKEFDFRPLPKGLSYGDPYRPIRTKINEVRAQFKPFRERYPCCLVLYSDYPHVADLRDSVRMLGAMYGDIALRIPFNTNTGEAFSEEREVTFYKEGKMFHFDSGRVQNTTVSAVISLFSYDAFLIRNRLRFEMNELELEELGLGSERREGDGIPGVIVWENYLAKIPFPRNLFNGPFDARWGAIDSRLNQIYLGKVLTALGKD